MFDAGHEIRLLNLQRQLSRLNLLNIDELGFVPLPRTDAELLFKEFSLRHERGATLMIKISPPTTGRKTLARKGSPEQCWTGSLATSTFWR